MSNTQNQPDTIRQTSKLVNALVYYAAYIILGLVISAMGPTLPGMSAQTGSTLSQISVIFSASSLGVVFGSFFGGMAYDRFKGHLVMALDLAALAVLVFLLPLMPTLWLLAMIVFLIGIGLGVIDVGGNTLIVWLFGREVGPYMNALHLCFGIGGFLSPLLVDRVVVAVGGIRWVYWILAGLIVPVVVWVLRVPSPAAKHDAGEETSAEPGSIRPYTLLIVMLAMFFFLHTGAEIGFSGWIFSYGVAIQIGADTVARLLNSSFWAGMILGRLLSIPLAFKLSPKQMLFIDLVGTLASLGLILLLPGWPAAVWIGTIGFGLSIASLFPTSLNFAGRRMPITGQVTSYFLIGGNLGSMLIPWLVGQLFEPVGPQSFILVLLIALVIALALLLYMLKYARRFQESAA